MLHVKVNVNFEEMNDPTIDKTRQVTSLDLMSSDDSVKPVSDGMCVSQQAAAAEYQERRACCEGTSLTYHAYLYLTFR